MLHLMAFFSFFFSLCQLDTCKRVVLFFMYICKCSLMPFMYVLFVKILSYVEEIKNIYLSISKITAEFIASHIPKYLFLCSVSYFPILALVN